ncbi:MAG: HAMP domain-containing sensor histidine kinase, partial [Clostridia bacterium]|nr:HAMP domain-containing sensor histidine kinase [Clostridia bacterium]
ETLNDGLVRSEEDRGRYYGYILRESLRLSRLINDLLELSRLQSGAVALVRESFDLAQLAREVAGRMGETAGYSGIQVRLELEGAGPLPAYSNRDRVEQVLVCLMDNAIKFASDDGVIVLAVRAEAEAYEVLVKNTGHIAEADLPHIFERFYKADTAHADSSGTGLGLAIARETIDRLGESIAAANEDGFAVFRFTVGRSAEGR